eukprot:3261380-Pyramimonas_sp.AAC.1
MSEFVGRPADVAGRNEGAGVRTVGYPSGIERIRERVAKASLFINWDVRKPRLIHYERSCGECGSRDQAVKNLYSAILESGVVLSSRHRGGAGGASSGRVLG